MASSKHDAINSIITNKTKNKQQVKFAPSNCSEDNTFKEKQYLPDEANNKNLSKHHFSTIYVHYRQNQNPTKNSQKVINVNSQKMASTESSAVNVHHTTMSGLESAPGLSTNTATFCTTTNSNTSVSSTGNSTATTNTLQEAQEHNESNSLVDANKSNTELISRSTQQIQTQQVTTVTKVYREVHHIGPDGQPIDIPESEYTNFPGPEVVNGHHHHQHHQQQHQQPSFSSGDNAAYNAQFHDSHYSNTMAMLNPSAGSAANLGQIPSPGSGSTSNTVSTANVNSIARMYDPYARNSQIGYQDYSNFNNYQDLIQQPPHEHLPTSGGGNSPQPPLRRHIMAAEMAAAAAAAAAAAQDSTYLPYGYPASGGQNIYGNFGPSDDGPQGFLDRRTYDDNNPYGQMGISQGSGVPSGGPPVPPPGMYEEAESAYQHLQALQQSIDPIYYQNNNSVSIQGVPPSRAMLAAAAAAASGVAPGSSAVTAIGPDGVRWRDPDLHEVIEFLNQPNISVRANAAAYLQHLCFMDDSMKSKTRALGGIPPLVGLLAQDVPEVQRNACGALRNLSYGRQNDENKRAIKNAGGIPALVRLLRKTPDNEIRELVTSVLWNLSSCEELKRPIIDDALGTLVSTVIIPHSGWERAQQNPSQTPEIYWSTVFRNASGVLRNVSSSGEYARRKLRECDALVDSILFLVRAAIGKNDMDNKSVENCVCVLRNLSYRCQEVIDPDYDKHPPGSPLGSSNALSNSTSPASTLSPSSSNSSKNSTSALVGGKFSTKVGENLSCFGGSKKKSSGKNSDSALSPSVSMSGLEVKTAALKISGNVNGPVKGMTLLWQTDVVQPYLALLSECSNPETLEAAAGAIQNLAACYWQPSIDIRGAVRKEKGLPILVELLRMEVDRVVCAVATALRNLAMDTRNKELIGKYALKDLVSKLPAPSTTGIPLETGTSDDTVAAVLATLNEVITKNADFAKSLLESGGMQRLTLIIKNRSRFSSRVVKFTSQLLYNMWQHSELREVYRKTGFKESNFIVGPNMSSSKSGTLGRINGQTGMMTPSASTLMMSSSSPTNGTLNSSMYHTISANNTLSRPMSTVGGTKYEDAMLQQMQRTGTLPRQPNAQLLQQRMQEEMAMNDLAQQQQQMALAAAQMSQLDGMLTVNGTGTLTRAPIGGVPIFPGVAPREPVYAQVNRERKRQQQQAAAAAVLQQQAQSQSTNIATHSPVIGKVVLDSNQVQSSSTNTNGANASNYGNLIDPTTNEPIYPRPAPPPGGGDSWV